MSTRQQTGGHNAGQQQPRSGWSTDRTRFILMAHPPPSPSGDGPAFTRISPCQLGGYSLGHGGRRHLRAGLSEHEGDPESHGEQQPSHRSDAFDGARSIAVEHGELDGLNAGRPNAVRPPPARHANRQHHDGKRQAIRTTGSDSHRRTSSVPRPPARLWGCRTIREERGPTNAISDPEASSTSARRRCSDAAGQPPARRTGPEHLGSGQLGGPPG